MKKIRSCRRCHHKSKIITIKGFNLFNEEMSLYMVKCRCKQRYDRFYENMESAINNWNEAVTTDDYYLKTRMYDFIRRPNKKYKDNMSIFEVISKPQPTK